MKKNRLSLVFAWVLILSAQSLFAQKAKLGTSPNYWHQVQSGQAPATSLMRFHPRAYLTFMLDEATLKTSLFNISTDPSNGVLITLPMPNGSFMQFKVWQTPIMPDELAAKYPEIKTFTAEAVGDQRITAKLDFTSFGFHAMVFEAGSAWMIDPYDMYHDGYYMVHYKKDEVRAYSEMMKCQVHSNNDIAPNGLPSENINGALPKLQSETDHHSALRTANGWTSRSYRLALSADHFYCQAATGLGSPTILQSLSVMTTSMNRINGVYNREFSVQMNFCTHEDTLIYPTATGSINGTDPFNAIDANPNTCLTTNQSTITTRIGSANFDLGHVFTTGGGGLSMLGVVCNNSLKAESVTGSPTPVGDGYDIDYVAHEMGHEFGSDHTFNNNMDGSCGGNAVNTCAYEPGSGGTIMDYAGICNPDDLQMHSDPYFSGSSLKQITAQLISTETACAVSAVTGNHLTTLTPFTATYTIPYKTPFELTGPTAVDSVADTANTYQWFQWNLGDFGKRFNQTYKFGPIFRSFNPVYNPTRIFPRLSKVLTGVLSDVGVEAAENEKAPDTARFLSFRMVVRDIMNGYGCFLFPDDSIHITAWQTGASAGYQGFKVTSQNTAGIVYTAGSSQTVTWNVVGTNGAPVNATNVDIFMSVDGGNTWPYTLGTFPNNGTASVTIPTVGASSSVCRIKVKGSGNVFFNINGQNFTVNPGAGVGPITGTLTVCQGATTTLADVTTGGTWSSTTTSVATISSTGVVTGVAGGTTTISYVAAGGTATVVVTVNPLPTVSPMTGGGTTICSGSTLSFSDATTGGTWSSSNTAVATVNTSGVVTGVAGGTTVISYALSNSCGTVAATMNATVSSAPGLTTAPVITIPGTTPCQGSTATYTATCTGATSFSWTVTGTGWSGTSTTGTLTATVGTGVGQIIVTGSNFCGNSPADTINVTPNVMPTTPSVALASALPCTGATTATYTATSTGATSFMWTVLGTGWSGTSTTASILVTLGTGTGTLICKAINSCGMSVADTINVTSSPMPSTPVLSLVGAYPCLGATAAVYTALSSGATTYNWTVSGTGWSGASSTNMINVTIGTGTGMIICSGINTCGTGMADTVYLTPASPVATPTSITATGGICSGYNVTFVTPVVAGATSYVWTVSGTGWSGTSTSNSIIVIVGTGTGTISVAAVGVCGTGSSYTLAGIVPQITPTASFIVASHTEYTGANDVISYTGTPSTHGIYTWNFAGGVVSPGTGVGPHLIHWNTTGRKTITLTVTDTGCTSIVFTDTVLVSNSTGIEGLTSNNPSISIMPNPNNGAFEILFGEAINKSVNVRLIDMQGRVVYSNEFDAVQNNKVSIDVTNLPNAIYTATIITDGAVTNKKVVVSR